MVTYFITANTLKLSRTTERLIGIIQNYIGQTRSATRSPEERRKSSAHVSDQPDVALPRANTICCVLVIEAFHVESQARGCAFV